MTLKSLLQKLEVTLLQGSLDTEVSGVAYDSRKVTAGCLFVCLTGFRSDGHDYLSMAAEQGAAVVVVERDVEIPAGITAVKVADSRYALALLAAAWFGNPAERMTIIGLTGTKGKTTTAHMVKAILEAAGNQVGMIGTIGAFIGAESIPTKNTTPESYELQALFARMAQAGCRYVVMEASSQGFKLHRTAGILFDYGVFLNLSPDHIGDGEHADFEEYLQCKSMLFRQSKLGIVNTDDEHWQAVTAGAACPIVTMSLRQEADFMARNVRELRAPGFLGSEFDLSGKLNHHLALNMPGAFNVENCLAAIAVAALEGVPVPAIEEALRFVTVKGRTQILETPGHYTVLIDYAHNAVSMENLLSMLRSYRPSRLICLFGGGGDRSRLRRYDMGEMSAKYADLTVLTMDNPRSERVEEINEDIKVGLARHDGEYISIPDRKEAIHYVLDHAKDGDIIALIGKGHEEYQEIQGVKHFFSEAQTVEEYFSAQTKRAN